MSKSKSALFSSAPACSQLHQIPAEQSSAQPDGVALWWQGNAVNYATLNHNVQAAAARLAAQGKPGERIAILSWNCPAFVELLYAVPASGRVMVPLNARLAAAELLYQLQSSGATTLFADPDLLGPLLAHADFPSGVNVILLNGDYIDWRQSARTADLPLTKPEDPVWILFTSGSTGRPKGAMLTHRSFMAGLQSAALARPVEPGDKFYYPFPLFHVAAHNVLLQHLYGAAVVLARSFDAAATIAACRELNVTTMSLAPTMIALLLDHPEFHPTDLQSVRTIGYGASAMPQSLLQRLLADTDVGLCQSYGMTELSGSVAFLTVADHQLAARDKPHLLQSVGKPLPTAQLKLLDDNGATCATGEPGEILVQAQQCMDGYWNDSAATANTLNHDWLHTGDIGRFDEEGYLYIVDRKKDMIISGGENVASREVEEVLRQHSAVRDCAVIGLADADWGECVCAVIKPDDVISNRELSDHCRRFLAGYKIPKHWFRVEDLPLNAAGKVDKPLLRRQYGAQSSQNTPEKTGARFSDEY